MFNDVWFWVQLLVALSGFAAVALYGLYFALKLRKSFAFSATAERLFLNTVIAIPLGAAWYVLPFLPQPVLTRMGGMGFRGFLAVDGAAPAHPPFFPLELFGPADWMRIAIGLAVLAGSLYFMVGFARQNIKVTFDDYAKPKALLITGVYKRVRHPGILTQFFAAAALAVITGGAYTLALLPLHAAALYYSAVFEERYVLIPLFNGQFEAYRRTTPAFRCRLAEAAGIALAAALCLAWMFPHPSFSA